MRRGLLIWLGILLCMPVATAQTVTYDKADSLCITSLLKESRADVLFFARKFLGRPYVAHTLEVNDAERLVVNTRQLDCTTLVETVTALTLCALHGQTGFDDYQRQLRQLRYRQGRLDGYTSRLHYFSDWIGDKQQMGLVTDVLSKDTEDRRLEAVGLKWQTVKVDYMSKHPQAYKSLKNHPEQVKTIGSQEKALTGLRCRYIPKEKVCNTAALRKVVADGDIIAITTSKPGLDIAHLGFAVWRKDGLHLLNASQLHKKVVEEPMTLGQYLSKHPSHTGIRVVRINQ